MRGDHACRPSKMASTDLVAALVTERGLVDDGPSNGERPLVDFGRGGSHHLRGRGPTAGGGRAVRPLRRPAPACRALYSGRLKVGSPPEAFNAPPVRAGRIYDRDRLEGPTATTHLLTPTPRKVHIRTARA